MPSSRCSGAGGFAVVTPFVLEELGEPREKPPAPGTEAREEGGKEAKESREKRIRGQNRLEEDVSQPQLW